MVTIHLDKDRRMKLTVRGMVAFEELTGKSLFMGFDLSKMNWKELTGLAWACVTEEDRELTYDAFLDLLQMGDVTKLTDVLPTCISEAFPDEEEGDRPLAGKAPHG